MIYLLLILNILLLVCGQTLWKIGLKNKTLAFTFDSIINLIFNPYILCGVLLYGVATLIWLYILSNSDLSLVYPLQSLCYVLALFVSIFILNESVPTNRWIGVGFIILGSFFIGIK